MDARYISMLNDQDKAKVYGEIRAWFNSDVQAQAPAITKGNHCYKFAKGNIFSNAEKAALADEDKVPVESTDGIIKISSMVGAIMALKKSLMIVGRGPEDAAPAWLRELALKDDVFARSGIETIENQILQDTLITGTPTWCKLVPTDPDDESKPGLHVKYIPWNAVVPDGNWRDPMCRDLRRISFINQMSYDSISARWFGGRPAKEIKQYADQQRRVAGDKSQDILQARTGITISSSGMVNVIETYYHTYMEELVSVDRFGNISIIPPLWGEEQIQQHIQTTGATVEKQTRKVLWCTVWTMDGMILEHGLCWYQGKGFPAAPYCPPNMDGEWVGVIEWAVDTLKEISYLRTERLQGLRTINNNLWSYAEDAIRDVEEFERERKRAGGSIAIKQGHSRDEVGPVPNQRENQAFNDALVGAQDDLSRLTVERNFEGGSQASQESSKAIGARVNQGLNKLQFFISGWHQMRRMMWQRANEALAYAYPMGRILRQVDPFTGEVQEHEVNKPVDFDWNGEVTRMANDLSFNEFDAIFTEGDDSISGREADRAIFLDFMKNFGNMPPETVKDLALSFPSFSVQKYGKLLEKKEAAMANQPPPPPQTKLNVTLDAATLGMEAIQRIAQQANLLPPPPPPPQAQEMQAPEQMPPQEGMPPMPPGEEMAE